MTSLQASEASAGRRCYAVVNPVHTCVYFAPEQQDELVALGLSRGSMAYLAGRAAPLGVVGAGTVAATFYNFNHEHVARSIPAAWAIATPEAVLAARLRGTDGTLRRLLGPEALTSAEMVEVAELSGIEALVLHNATGTTATSALLMRTRGWSAQQWADGQDQLRERGLLDEAGELTQAGAELRGEAEALTDRLDAAPYEHLGSDATARLAELAGGFSAALRAVGAFPAALFGKG